MSAFSTRTSRRKLPRSQRIRWTKLARGRALGYRRSSNDAGTWYVRVYTGRKPSPYQIQSFATADDLVPSDGSAVLTYGEATKEALAWDYHGRQRGQVHTVGEVVAQYLAWYQEHRKDYQRRSQLFRANVLPLIGQLELTKLSARELRSWHEALARSPAKLRGGQTRPARTEEQRRARKVTANRALSALKAALNRAWGDGLITGERAWDKVKPFRDVEASRLRYLDGNELRRLVNTCEGDFRLLVRAAIYTGARYSEICALEARDVNIDAKVVSIAKSKSGLPRNIFLGVEALRFFERLTVGVSPRSRLFKRADGLPWGRNHQSRRMAKACRDAEIDPPVGFHQLRHTYASEYLMNGGSLVALAKQLGHSTTRMVERHYGHLADSWRAEEADLYAPRLGLDDGADVASMQLRR